MHEHRVTLMTERQSLTRKIQGLFNQSDDKFMSYCGKTFKSGSFQKSPAPAVLFRAQKVKQEQQDFWLDQFSLGCPGCRKLSDPLQNSSSV